MVSASPVSRISVPPVAVAIHRGSLAEEAILTMSSKWPAPATGAICVVLYTLSVRLSQLSLSIPVAAQGNVCFPSW